MGNDKDPQADLRGGNPNRAKQESAPGRRQVEMLRNCLAEKAIGTFMASVARRDRTRFTNQILKLLYETDRCICTVL